MPLDIDIPHDGWEPREYQRKAWSFLDDGGKRASLIWHRRAGKDDLVLQRFAVSAVERVGSYWHLLPTHEQARKALWNGVNPHTGRRRIFDAFPKALIKRLVDKDMMIEFINGSTYQVFGSDNHDAAVGSSPVGMAFSEWALADPSAWGVFSPMLVENNGWAVFITTPRGRNHAFELHMHAEQNEGWFSEILTVDDTQAIDPAALEEDLNEKISLYGEELGRALFEQEWYCLFETPSDQAFIPSHLVAKACSRELDWGDVEDREKVIGVDVARFGADRSVVIQRHGPYVHEPLIYESVSNTELAGIVSELIQSWGPDAVFVDAGRGEGVIDRLRAIGHKPVEINFGGRALSENRYVNRRAEMWAKLKEALTSGLALPNHIALKTDLSTPEYKFDKKDRLQLEAKDDIKKRGLRSPDVADALALTFAAPARAGSAAAGGRGRFNRPSVKRAFDGAKRGMRR